MIGMQLYWLMRPMSTSKPAPLKTWSEIALFRVRPSPSKLFFPWLTQSVFLRALDYFQGILFLTTNRVGRFDEAFMSRIHVSIGYERLDDNARAQIWDNLFDKLKEDFKRGGPRIEYEYDAKYYVKKNKDVKNLQWNGREIRNGMLQLLIWKLLVRVLCASILTSNSTFSLPDRGCPRFERQ